MWASCSRADAMFLIMLVFQEGRGPAGDRRSGMQKEKRGASTGEKRLVVYVCGMETFIDLLLTVPTPWIERPASASALAPGHFPQAEGREQRDCQTTADPPHRLAP
jgi:hypothetical protein